MSEDNKGTLRAVIFIIILFLILSCEKQSCYECIQSTFNYEVTQHGFLFMERQWWEDSTFMSFEDIYIDTDTLKINCILKTKQ